jgi:hypothetical protein
MSDTAKALPDEPVTEWTHPCGCNDRVVKILNHCVVKRNPCYAHSRPLFADEPAPSIPPPQPKIMSIPEEVRRTAESEIAAQLDACEKATRAFTRELEVEIMRRIAKRLETLDSPDMDIDHGYKSAAYMVGDWADELEASMKGGDDAS